jgi:hypothetical protein
MFLRPSAAARLTAAFAICIAPIAGPDLAAATSGLPLAYVSPMPGATNVLRETNVIVRPGGIVDAASLRTVSEGGQGSTITVEGSLSGDHAGRLTLSDDRRTLHFRPDVPFLSSEEVRIRIGAGLRTDKQGEIPPTEFAFTVAGPEREALRDLRAPVAEEDLAGLADLPSASARGDPSAVATADPLPPDFPVIEATVTGKTTPGRIFLTNLDLSNAYAPSYLLILNDDGTPYWYRRMPSRTLDFKMQVDGRLSYFDRSTGAHMVLDSTYTLVDSFRCGNGYTTDFHDFVLLPDGHALIMSYDPQIVDMSQIVPKGRPDAIVFGLVIQELDREKEVVFQWRSWDHFQITDAIGAPLGGRTVDYVHGNSIDADPEGNLLISSRHLDEVTKIDRETGEITWRLGGKNNQFAFVNDPIGFSHQHSARFLTNGNITLFDNGVFRTPRFSRAVEYAIDEKKKTATLVWEHRHDPDVFGIATGNVQRLPSGNTLIQWGTTTPTLNEVTPDGRVVSELSFEQGVFAYRAFRFEWPRVREALVTLSPRAILSSRDRGWVTATIEPVGFDASAIDVATVTLGDAVPAVLEGPGFGDANSNGISDLTVSFRLDAVAALLDETTTWLTVEGALIGGGRFRGYASVRTLTPRDAGGSIEGAAGIGFRLVSPRGALPVVVDGGAGAPGAGAPTVSIHDVRGRLVRRWTAAPSGHARISWDGRRDDGRPVASGIYFLRIETPGTPARAEGRILKVLVAR